jgi:hypothetical protein
MKFWITVVAVFLFSFGVVAAFRTPTASPMPDRPIDGLSSSDDFARYGTFFQTAARELVRRGICTDPDFKELGGFVRSQNNKSQGVYFTYCGGMAIGNRIYVKIEGDDYSLSR